MNTIYKIIIGMVLMVSTVYSQTDISFKFGLPLSSAQLLLKEKNIAGKNWIFSHWFGK